MDIPYWLRGRAHSRAEELGITYEEAISDLADMYFDSPHTDGEDDITPNHYDINAE